MSQADHLHIYNFRGYCWCGVHRDDWLRDENMLESIGKAFTHLREEAERGARLKPAEESRGNK